MDKELNSFAYSYVTERNSSAYSYVGYKLASSVCALIFITLVSVDVWKAFRRKASWIPGQALVLSAFTIQLLIFIDHLDVSTHSNDPFLKDSQLILLVEEQLLIDSRRVMICVFIAYLLPGMVNRGLKTVWGDVGALALAVIAHMAFEAYFLLTIDAWEDFYASFQTALDSALDSTALYSALCSALDSALYRALYSIWQPWSRYRVWLIPYYIALSLAIILLVVLLSCAAIAGKSIRNIVSQKVPLALSSCCNSAENRLCKNIEDHVLKSWIVVRVCQPDYIMARSVFTAFAGVVVTVCVVLLVVKWICVPLPHYGVDITVYAIQFAFVVVGSMVVVFRWLTAVFYFPKDVRGLLYLEDFWSRRLVQHKDDLRGHWTIRLFLSILLTVFIWAQKLIVSLSKVCWYISQFVFGIIRPFIMIKKKSDQFSKYEEVLELIRMPGENAYSLWRANESAFEKTENHFKKGIKDGESSSKELIDLIDHKTGTPEDEAPTSLREEKDFKAVGKNSWKMRAVSLIHLIIYFYDETNSGVVNDCMEAYRQALGFMHMVDRSDPEAKLARKAADKEFYTLENVWKKHGKRQSRENSNRNRLQYSEREQPKPNKELEEKIKKPLRKNMDKLWRQEKAGDIEGQRKPSMDTSLQYSNDLKTVAARISLYKRWKAMDLESTSENAIHKLRCLLANVIFHCLEEEVLNKALTKNCNKWAEDGKENKIFNAAYIAGKAKGLRQEILKDKDAGVVVEGA